MAITSIGYDGSVNETEWAKLIPLAGSSHYGVSGTNDWKVTTHATMDRGVNIATGSGWGHGILDTSSSTVSLQGNSVGSGSRWDCVVARRNWSGTGGSTQFFLVQGTSTKQIPSRNTTPGTIDDQPIALVKFTAGQSAAQEIIDLRCWGRNGGMAARDELVLTYLTEMATQIKIGDVLWTRAPDHNGNPVWTSAAPDGTIGLFGVDDALQGSPSGNSPFLIQAGSVIQTTDGNGYCRLTWPKPFPNGLLTVIAISGDDYAVPRGFPSGSGGPSFGVGGKNYWTYRFLQADGDAYKNRIHRINWIAIGW